MERKSYPISPFPYFKIHGDEVAEIKLAKHFAGTDMRFGFNFDKADEKRGVRDAVYMKPYI